MAFEIEVTTLARDHLKALRKFEQRKILDRIKKQLGEEPAKESRNRKQLEGAEPDFACDPPLWELRVGDLRVFYDVDEDAKYVFIRAVRRKPPEKTTGEVIHEKDNH